MLFRSQKVILGLKRISKPGLRVYADKNTVPKVLNGLGISIISTSKGILTDKQARELGVGGEVVCSRFVTNPGVRGNRIDPGRKNNRRDRTVKTGDRIDHNFIPVNVNPGKKGVLLVSADRDDPPPEVKK